MNSLSCDTMRDLIGALLFTTIVVLGRGCSPLIYFNSVDVGSLLHALISPFEEAL